MPVVTATTCALDAIPPSESPVIQVTPPSPELIDSWSSPVALETSAAPITTLLEPEVMLFPASCPMAILVAPDEISYHFLECSLPIL